MPILPATRRCILADASDGALLSFGSGDDEMHFGPRGWRSDDQGEKSPAFVELRAAEDDTEEVAATVVPSVGKHDIVLEPGAPILEHGTDWVLRVLPDAWRSTFGISALTKAGALLAGKDGDLSILAFSYDKKLLRLSLRTWRLTPFHERDCFVARHWSIAVVTTGAGVGWSLP